MSAEKFEERLTKLETALNDRDGQIKKLEELARGQAKQIDTIRKTGNTSGNASNNNGETKKDGSQVDYALQSKQLEEKAWFWTADVVRSTFKSYFVAKRDHTFWPSSPILPSQEDDTLLFVNSGMVQYKPIFVGRIPQGSAFENMKRAANSQKCVRAGGKHNDLEDVGRDNYHHTYFEMLGNWSFGDYFKAEAIDWAWDLLTNVFGLPGDRLYATYFEGYTNKETGVTVPADTEAKKFWLKYLPESHVLPGNMKDNFWEMGDTGPCGPCSELHFDRIGGGRDASSLVNMDDPNVLEIWNLVFMQFYRHEDRSLSKLPACHVDTGMGFERLVSVLQCKPSNYDTDVFSGLFDAVYQLRVEEYNRNQKNGDKSIPKPERYMGRMGAEAGGKGDTLDANGVDTAYRVIVDHIRTLTFSVTDRIQIGNVGRGYVLKRILRRGVRYGKQFLHLPNGFFAKLVSVVCDLYGSAFPELKAENNVRYVTESVAYEETAFLANWVKGEQKFKQITDKLKAANETVIPGEDVAYLYQCRGFPVDLTRIMAEDAGMTVDEEGFKKAQNNHIEASKGETKIGDGTIKTIVLETAHMAVLQKEKKIAATDDSLKYNVVEGVKCNVTLHAIFDGDNFLNSAAAVGESIGLVFDRSPFYAEQGGQVSDTGTLTNDDGSVEIDIVDCKKFGEYTLHQGVIRKTTTNGIQVGMKYDAEVNITRRNLILPNHTMTHVLNLGLRQVLPQDQVDQKGSRCDTEKLRFDFNCRQAVTSEQLQKVEEVVREQINLKLKVDCKVVPLASAKEITTLRAVFGETYPDPVRVVSVGKTVDELLNDPTNPEWMKYSVELCGGTHLTNTETAGAFVIAEEGGIAKGIRRVTCLTGEAAKKAIENGKAFQEKINNAKKLGPKEMLDEQKRLASSLGDLVCSCYLKEQFSKELTKMFKTASKAADSVGPGQICKDKASEAKASG
jgi:alanyl-tRNA synthetase